MQIATIIPRSWKELIRYLGEAGSSRNAPLVGSDSIPACEMYQSLTAEKGEISVQNVKSFRPANENQTSLQLKVLPLRV